MANAGEAQMAAAAGADMIGLVGPMPSGAGVQTAETCRQVASAAPAWVTPVLLTASESPEAVEADVRHAGVRAVQLVRHVAAGVHDALAERLPGVRRLQVIHVEDGGALDLMGVYGERPDAYLLDSGRPGAAELGGTGRVHDWAISAEFVRRAPRPVFLAGGLNPGNAAQALAEVRPFGLDICSGVRTDGHLDEAKLTAFMDAAT